MHRSKGKLSGVLHKGFKPDKCKTALRMALARIKLLRNRKEVQVRQMRREVAQLLDANQDQTARIRVEHVIREEKFMQAYDLIEVYCELMVARLSIIDSQKTCPIDLKEAIASVIFASMRCSDVTELVDVRKHFTSKYGKEFVAAALEVRPDSGVNRLVIEKLSAGAPDTQTKIKTLTSIAEEHNIKWEPKAFEETLQKQNEDLLHGSTYSGGNIPSSVMPTSQSSAPSYSYVESPNSRVPTAHSYSSAEVPDNNASYVAANPNAYSRENRGGSEYSVPPSSQHAATAYSSAQIPGPDSFSHENTGGPNVCRPYSQYGATVPDTASRSEEFNQPRERKSSASGSNWNVEFRDATSAAQAAAESAEMASFAARAAAQLASRGNFSAEKNTEPFESAAYTHETTPRKQQADHLMKDGQRSFSEQTSGANDPMFISSNARKDRERAETNRVGSVNISAPFSSAQFHSHSPDIHEYGMPTEPDRTHSPKHPYSDDSSEKESNFGRPEDHAFNLPGERLFDAQLDGRNIEDTESKHSSFDLENTDNYYRNYSSSHGTFTHGSSTIWDNQNDKTGADSSAVVFDQYDSVVGEENLLARFSSKHTEEPAVQDHMGFSNADWSQQHRSTSPVNHSTSTLFSRTETHPSYNLEVNRKDIPSPHSYDNVAPTFDSDGVSSDEEVTTAMHAKPLRSHSRGSGFCESKEEIISGKVVRDINESIEDYHNSSGSNTFYKEQYGDSSPRSYYSGAYRNLGHIKSRDYDLSEEEEMVPHKLDGASSGIAEPNEREPFSFGRQTSATSTDYNGGDTGLNFGRLTPGLRNKLRQPLPYTKDSGDNMLPKQLVHKTPAIVEKSVYSEENNNLYENTRNTSTSTTPRSSLGADYNSELYDQHQSVEARVEARSTMRRSYFESGGDRGKLSEQSSDAPSSMMNKSSVGVNSSQELYHEKPGVGAHRETRTQTAKSYLDSDSEDELGQREKGGTKWSTEQTRSRRTREVTADTKRETRVQIGGQHDGSFSKLSEQSSDAPSSMMNNSSVGVNSSQELYHEKPGVGARRETRTQTAKSYLDSDSEDELGQREKGGTEWSTEQTQSGRTREVTADTKREIRVQIGGQHAGSFSKLSEQSSNAPSSMMNKSSVGVNSSQELYHEKPGVGARRETRTQNAKSYLDSDSEDELGQREKGGTKWYTEQTQSRRTREVTSDTKRETRVRIGVRHAGETESMPKEAKSPTGSFSKFTEQRREAPGYSRSRVPAPRTSPKPVRLDPPSRREKPQEADLNTVSVTGKEDNTESSAKTPKESTPKTAPAHVHPKLPTDYDAFAAHFMSLRTNRR